MSYRGRDRGTQLVVADASFDFTKNTLLSSNTRIPTERQRKRKNCNRHSQVLERRQLSDKGRNRATQLVAEEVSVDFTKHTAVIITRTRTE